MWHLFIFIYHFITVWLFAIMKSYQKRIWGHAPMQLCPPLDPPMLTDRHNASSGICATEIATKTWAKNATKKDAQQITVTLSHFNSILVIYLIRNLTTYFYLDRAIKNSYANITFIKSIEKLSDYRHRCWPHREAEKVEQHPTRNALKTLKISFTSKFLLNNKFWNVKERLTKVSKSIWYQWQKKTNFSWKNST